MAVLVASLGVPGFGVLRADQPALVQWGSNHVGQMLPEYMTGDECLFCHRDIGPTWPENPHQATLRPADPGQPEIQSLSQLAQDMASEVDFLLGDERLVRYLKRSQAYGRLDLLSARYVPEAPTKDDPGPHLIDSKEIDWNGQTFGDRCAGCHTTAVDSTRRTFSATSLDCYACHGHVVEEHTTDTTQVLLSKVPQNALVVNSICGSCHLRGGASRNSKLPYPSSFVPGDNLFLDFQVDFSDAALARLPRMQQHMYVNALMVGSGWAEPTCIDCHSVHRNNSRSHTDLPSTKICLSCHVPETDNSQLTEAIQNYDKSTERNATCDY
jgi:hypothetical protein